MLRMFVQHNQHRVISAGHVHDELILCALDVVGVVCTYVLQEAVAIDPHFAEAYSNMGNAFKDLGEVEEAIKCFTAAIKLKPDLAHAYCNLASAFRDAGRFQVRCVVVVFVVTAARMKGGGGIVCPSVRVRKTGRSVQFVRSSRIAASLVSAWFGRCRACVGVCLRVLCQLGN